MFNYFQAITFLETNLFLFYLFLKYISIISCWLYNRYNLIKKNTKYDFQGHKKIGMILYCKFKQLQYIVCDISINTKTKNYL